MSWKTAPGIETWTATEIKDRVAIGLGALAEEQVAAIQDFVVRVGSIDAARQAVEAMQAVRKAA